MSYRTQKHSNIPFYIAMALFMLVLFGTLQSELPINPFAIVAKALQVTPR